MDRNRNLWDKTYKMNGMNGMNRTNGMIEKYKMNGKYGQYEKYGIWGISITLLFLFFFSFRYFRDEYRRHDYRLYLTKQLGRTVAEETDPYLFHRFLHYKDNKDDINFRFLQGYSERVRKVKKETKSRSIILTGLLRDNGKEIIANLESFWIPLLTKNFQDYAILLLENSSKDDTRTLLEKMEKRHQPHVRLLSFPISTHNYHKQKVSSSERTNMMAKLRNELLDYLYHHRIHNIHVFDESTVVLMMDPDLLGVMSEDAFLHGVWTLYKNPELLAVGVNTITEDHRIFDTFPFVPIYDSFEWTSEKDKNRHDVYIQSRYSQEIVWERTKPLMMHSTFNGMVLYDFARFQTKVYYPLFEEENGYWISICEHTRFHMQFPMGTVALDPLWIFQLQTNLF